MTKEGHSEDGAQVLDQLSDLDQTATQVDTESEPEEGAELDTAGPPEQEPQGPLHDDTDESEPESESATSDSESLESGNFDGPLSPTTDDTAFPPPPTPAPDSGPSLGPGPSTDSESGGESFSMSSDDEPRSGDQSPNMGPSSPLRVAEHAMGVSMEAEADRPLYEVNSKQFPVQPPINPSKWDPTYSLLRVVPPTQFPESSVNVCVCVQ